MILGTGIDVVEIERVREAVSKWGERFLRRIYTKHEIEYCFSKRDPFPGLSARFAAKEAAIKALSGILKEHHLAFHEIEVLNEPSGKPGIVLAA
jgi:holo-[acyl-carrier protein] synthase